MLSDFNNATCPPSSASNGKTMCQANQPSREPAFPAYSPSCFRCSCAGLAASQGWKTYACPKAVFFSELQERKHDCGAPRKRYNDQLKRQLAQAGISRQSRQQKASDRDSWRSSVRKASCEFQAEKHKTAKEKRRRQKERAASLPSSSQTFVCPKCGRGCASRIGLYSHQRACKN